MMKNIILLLAISGFLIADTFAQVSKTVVAEHFTNTVCGICGNRNPDLWATLDAAANADVLHVSYHPSSPFSSCLLNQFDTNANDARLMFYNQFGTTPKILVNGTDLITSSNFSNVNLFDAYFTETTPIELDFIANANADKTELSLKVTVKNAADHQLDDLVIFAAVAEELVDYSSPNGEDEHHNVFRQAFTALEGDPITIDGTSGNEFEFNYTLQLNSALSAADLFAYVILQQGSSQEVVQALKNEKGTFVVPVSTFDIDLVNNYYPNPVSDYLYLEGDFNDYQINVFDINGELLISDSKIESNRIDLSHLNSGIYMLNIFNHNAQQTLKVIKE